MFPHMKKRKYYIHGIPEVKYEQIKKNIVAKMWQWQDSSQNTFFSWPLTK
jgi:hypothetical protein